MSGSRIWRFAWLFFLSGSIAASGLGATGESTFLPAESSAIVRARAAALLMSGQEGGNLSLGVLAVPLSEGDLRSKVVVVAEIPGPELLRDATGQELPVEVFVYALGSNQEVRGQANLAVRLDLEGHRSLLESAGLKIVTSLRLLPGEHLIRVLVRTAAGGFGARSYPVMVPQPGAPRASLALVEETASWLVLTDPPTSADPGATYPLAWSGRRRVPAAVAQLRGQGPWEAWVIAGGTTGTPALTARFRDLDGVGAASAAVEVAEQVALVDEGALRIRIGNPGLGPGRYELRLLSRSASGSDLESPGLPLRIERTGQGGEEPSQIAEAQGSGTSRAGRQRAETKAAKKAAKKESARKSDRDLAPYMEGYRLVLASVGEGEQRAVDRSLEGLVQATWEELEEDAPMALGEALALVLEQEQDPWARMLPVIQAHLELAERGLEDWKYSLAQFGARTALDLAVARATVLGTQPAAREAAAVATCLAEAYLGTGSRGLAAILLERALHLDDEQEAALLLRAALQEKEGRYAESAATLRRLVDTHPGHGEGLLRLAVQEVRLRQSGRARRRFEGLLEGPAASWVQLLAVQELARLHRDAGRREQAKTVLDDAAERWPDNPRLKILRAQLLDDQGSYLLSRFLAAAKEEGFGEISEREIYNRWPVEPVRRLAVELRAAAREILAQAQGVSETLMGAAR